MQTNTEKLTKKYCKGKVLVFMPVSPEEADAIDKKLRALGFEWNGPRILATPEECARQGIVAADGRLSLRGLINPVGDDALLCTLPQFDSATPPAQLTYEYLCTHDVGFRPKTAEEAIEMQNRLFDLGFYWMLESALHDRARNIDSCLEYGFSVRDNRLSTAMDRPDMVICTLDNLPESAARVQLRAEFRSLRDEIAAQREMLLNQQAVIIRLEKKIDDLAQPHVINVDKGDLALRPKP